MNMNQRNLIDTGNVKIGKTISANQVDFPDSKEHLTQILSSFNFTDILITLARTNLFLQCSKDFSLTERILQKNFCSRYLRDEIDWRGLTGDFIFNRQSTLRLLSESVRVSDSYSTRSPDTTDDAKIELARCYLIANESPNYESSDHETGLAEEKRKELLVASIPFAAYPENSAEPRRIKNPLVRSKEFLRRFQEESSKFDMNKTFHEATGLTPQGYQYLIYSIAAFYLTLSPEEILKGEGLFVDTRPSPTLAQLYEKLLPHVCISIDALRDEARLDCFKNDFRLWRRYPLVKVGENQICCVDIGFLLDKLQTGVFWILREHLKNDSKGKGVFEKLWGDVFTNYAASIIKRGINAETSFIEKCMLGPKYIQKSEAECTDIAVCGEDTLILLECKSSVLAASAKFSGNFEGFYDGIASNAIKGIKQLTDAIQSLVTINEAERCKVEGINISSMKKIYPVLVLFDHTFSSLDINRFLNSEFQRIVKQKALVKHMEIMSLTVLTIEDLELLEPYMSDTPFHVHLDKWIAQFAQSGSILGFRAYLYSLIRRVPRKQSFIDQESDRIATNMMEKFDSWGLK